MNFILILVICVNEHVFGLEISMHDFFCFVKVNKRFEYLLTDLVDNNFAEASTFCEHFLEIATFNMFHHDVYGFWAFQKLYNFDYVNMVNLVESLELHFQVF